MYRFPFLFDHLLNKIIKHEKELFKENICKKRVKKKVPSFKTYHVKL